MFSKQGSLQKRFPFSCSQPQQKSREEDLAKAQFVNLGSNPSKKGKVSHDKLKSFLTYPRSSTIKTEGIARFNWILQITNAGFF